MGGKEIPFLDTVISLSRKGIALCIEKRRTATCSYIIRQCPPLSWKKGLIRCFLHRADVICSDKNTIEEEHNKLKDIFYQNGYPLEFFAQVKHQYMDARNRRKDTLPCENTPVTSAQDLKPVLKIPYVGKISASFAKRLKRLLDKGGQDTRVVYRTTKVANWFSLKDPDPKEITSKVVYEFECRGDQDIRYIGYTDRTLRERVMDHLGGKTAISDHISTCARCSEGVSINDFKILKKCRYKNDTAIHEALAIKSKRPILNKKLIKPGKTFTLRIFD